VEILPSRTAGTTTSIPEKEEQDLERLRSALEHQGFRVGYSAGLFQGLGDTAELYHDVCHLHSLGHQIYSKYLVERIEQQSEVFRKWASPSLVVAEQAVAEPKGESK